MKEIVEKIDALIAEEMDFDSDYGGYCDLSDYDFGEYYFKEVDTLDTISSGKYEDGGTVYQVYKTGGEKLDIFYLLPWSRTGSYYTDWHYSIETPYQVVKKTKTIQYWG